jgi:hypothetical protein
MQIDSKNPKFGNTVGTCKKLAILLPVMWASHYAPWRVAILWDVVKET